MESKIHYIIGLGRSGSTLLSSILNNHNDIKSIPEIPFIIFFLYHKDKLQTKNSKFNRLLIEYLKLCQKLRPINLINLNTDKIKATADMDYYTLCKHVFAKFEVNNIKGGTPIFLDKNPPNTLHYKRLTSLSPESKFIILVRDYRSFILSKKSKPYANSANVIVNAIRWKYFHIRIKKYYKNTNCLLVRYEDFVSDINSELTRICSFLEIDFDKNILEYSKIDFSQLLTKSEATDSFIKNHFPGLNENVNSNRIKAWETELTLKEIEITESICGKIGEKYYYKKTVETNNLIPYFFLYPIKCIKGNFNILKELMVYFLPLKFKMRRFRKSLNKLL